MALFAREPQAPELYGILNDASELYKQLNRPTSDYEALGRYPSFHPPAGSSSSGVVGSNPTGEVTSYLTPASAASHSHSRMRPSETSHEDAQPSQVSADPTGQSWFNPEAQVWKPKKSSNSNKTRNPPPSRSQPQVPPSPAMYGYGSPAPPQPQQGQRLTGIRIKEPEQQFSKTKGPPRKSAMKTPSQQPSPLPTNAYLAPSWISAPRPSRRPVAYYGPSTGTPSVAFNSSSYNSSSTRVPYEDDSPIEPPNPRQTLFVISEDPDSGSEKSPVVDKKQPYVPLLPSIPSASSASSSSNNNPHQSTPSPAMFGYGSPAPPPQGLNPPTHESEDKFLGRYPPPNRITIQPSKFRTSSSTVTELSIKAPPSIASEWVGAWSRAETSSSILDSQFGTSTSTSIADFRSSAAFTSSSYYSSWIPRSTTRDRIPYEDDPPSEFFASIPRQNLLTTNGGPDSSSPETSLLPSSQPRYDSDSETTASSSAEESIPGVVGSNPTGEVSSSLSPASAAGHSHSDYSQSKYSPRPNPLYSTGAQSMALGASRQPQVPELYGILDDGGDLYKHLNRPISDYEALGRYPSFHPPAGSSSSGVVGSNPTGEVSSSLSPASAAGHSHSDYSQSKHSPRPNPLYSTGAQSMALGASRQPQVPELYGILDDGGDLYKHLNRPISDYEALGRYPSFHPPAGSSSSGVIGSNPTGEVSSYLSPTSEAEVWKPKKSSNNNKMREPPPAPAIYGYGSPAPPQGQPLTGSLVKEPAQSFVKTSSAGGSIPAEWICPLLLTLEELFKGGTYTYRITTRLLSGEPKIQEVQIDVKPGWNAGARIIFPDAGNERAPGVFQTMIFVVDQVHHERFARHEGGKLVYYQAIDLVDAVKENGRREVRKVTGLDGKVIEFYPPKGVINPGQETVIKGEGMYTRSKNKVIGRGDLIIRWNIKFPDQVTPDQTHRTRDIFKQ